MPKNKKPQTQHASPSHPSSPTHASPSHPSSPTHASPSHPSSPTHASPSHPSSPTHASPSHPSASHPSPTEQKRVVKVGLDQWIVASASKHVDLITNGLSGCVGLGLISPEQFCLAHVFSDCTEKTWAEYKGQLDILLRVMEKKAKLKEASLTISEGTPNWLPETLKNWLLENKLPNNKILTYRASGCRLAYSSAMSEVEVFEYEHDNKELYTKGYSKASNAGQFIDGWGTLSNHAADAS
jgi:hypothetical protein